VDTAEPKYIVNAVSAERLPMILTAFEAVQTINQSGTVVDLPIPWAQVRQESRSLTEQERKL
jgi:hypothetical protein